MPSRAQRPCAAHPWNLISDSAGCPDCVAQPVLERPRMRDNRPNATKRGYGFDEWKKKVRDPFIAKHPYCADPFHIHPGKQIKAIIVDHKIPRKQGGTDANSNLQSLCHKCHNFKTARDGSRHAQGGGVQNFN